MPVVDPCTKCSSSSPPSKTITTCGKYYVECSGTIVSANNATQYADNTNCTYVLMSPPNTQIQVTSQMFITEANHDTLTVS